MTYVDQVPPHRHGYALEMYVHVCNIGCGILVTYNSFFGQLSQELKMVVDCWCFSFFICCKYERTLHLHGFAGKHVMTVRAKDDIGDKSESPIKL